MSSKISNNHVNDDFDNFEMIRKRDKGRILNEKFKNHAKERDKMKKQHREQKHRDYGM